MATAFLTPKNNAYSTLASGITDVATSITVATGEGARFPSANFNISIELEIINVVSRSGDVFTCTAGRGAESTVAASHSAGAAINLYTTAKAVSDLNTAVNTVENLIAYMSRKNIIINGGFTVNQGVYVSAAALAAGGYGHDGWKGGSGGGTYSFTQLASPTTITIAANKTLIQVIEDKMVYGGSYILSWIGTCQARYAINSATPAGAYAASPIVIAGQTAGTTMSVEFGNGASSGTLGEVQLELGSVPTVFDFKPFSIELILCQRYYEKSYPYATAVGYNFNLTALDAIGGLCDGGLVYTSIVAPSVDRKYRFQVFKTEKRATPTMVYYDLGGTAARMTSLDTNSAFVANNITETYQSVAGSTPGFYGQTAANLSGFCCHWTASARL